MYKRQKLADYQLEDWKRYKISGLAVGKFTKNVSELAISGRRKN
jgi:hypothetical protein